MAESYTDIANRIGLNLKEYNPSTLQLLGDKMKSDTENGELPRTNEDLESLLAYSFGYISQTNKKVKNNEHFTYYTQDGPQKSINSEKPILAQPDKDALIINNDQIVDINEDNPRIENGRRITYGYGEHGGNIIGSDEYYLLMSGENSIDKTSYKSVLELQEKYSNTLLAKTNQWFQDGVNDYISRRFAETISRFHTEGWQIDPKQQGIGMQGFSKFGYSHGNNVLKAKGIGKSASSASTDSYGYEDPYCRVWKWHKQYHSLKDTIRPFNESTKVLNGDEYNWSFFRSRYADANGGDRLTKYGSMYDGNGETTGLVNITPSITTDSNKKTSYIDVKKCMFSIENLAWKGTYKNRDNDEEFGLSKEQKGPLGGRIMWFPPYDIKFNETTQADWQRNDFIGRGEPIFTYANTTRSGTLSFKLLIDHPAILDYWERRNDNEYNVNNSLTDNVESKEQELLRFFAGCSVLKARKPVDPPKSKEPEKKDEPEEEATDNSQNTIQFFVFYPNNYSGKDDKAGGLVDPIEYLMNGVGAQLIDTQEGETQIEKLGNPENTETLRTDVYTNYVYEGEGEVGGYEMRSDYGISVVKTDTSTNSITILRVGDNSDEYINLVKMIGSEADKATIDIEGGQSWHKKRYYYRADKETLNQVLVGNADNGAISYIDKFSHQLNSVGYLSACEKFGVDQNTTYSMADVFVALKGRDNVVYDLIKDSDEEKITELESILSGEKGSIRKIICKGLASSQANNQSEDVNQKRNDTLAKNRAETILNWLKENMNVDSKVFDNPTTFKVDDNKSTPQDDSNDLYAKLNRAAKVEIVYGGAEIEDGNETKVVMDENGNPENNSSTLSNDVKGADITEDEKEVETMPSTNTFDVRYDSEAQFFEKLTRNDPFMAKLISERIKNFDPVFHSMSPEGFHARLTFLNQCMRQGPTISSSDTNGNNANNMAFGRPPVCVLRVGDFYNTKIIINNLNIEYDPLTWDLNQEGIGVMPMIANVSISFYFIGGSELGGPIQRLQNATSFNYYANTSVYDNRAERIDYNGNGDVDKFYAFDPYINF